MRHLSPLADCSGTEQTGPYFLPVSSAFWATLFWGSNDMLCVCGAISLALHPAISLAQLSPFYSLSLFLCQLFPLLSPSLPFSQALSIWPSHSADQWSFTTEGKLCLSLSVSVTDTKTQGDRFSTHHCFLHQKVGWPSLRSGRSVH